jgi:hypothetical protein
LSCHYFVGARFSASQASDVAVRFQQAGIDEPGKFGAKRKRQNRDGAAVLPESYCTKTKMLVKP